MLGNPELGHASMRCRVCMKELVVARETWTPPPNIWRPIAKPRTRHFALHVDEVREEHNVVDGPPKHIMFRVRVALEDRCLARQQTANI